MKNKRNEIFIDEDGERWKILKEIPCPRKLEPRKQTFKICFEVEYELELAERQMPHKHIVREKVNSSFSEISDKVLYGDIEDSGKADCMEMQVRTKANVNVKQTALVKKFDNDTPKNYSLHDRIFCKLNDKLFREEIAYLEKHLSNALKNVFPKLKKRLRANTKNWQSPSFDDERAKFIKRISEIKKALLKEGKKINLINVGEVYYTKGHSNPIQQLNRDLDSFIVDFDEI